MTFKMPTKKVLYSIITAVLIAAAAVGAFLHSKKAEAEEVTLASEATRINVSDEGGVRACDIFQGNDGTTREQIEAFAKRTGCKLNAWRKDVAEKLQHKAPEAANDEKVAAPAAPTLNVAPAPAKTISAAN